jgi:hypothetical protein
VTSEFDFRFHADRSGCIGTQYFEFMPGPYGGSHWVPSGRFIAEDTFCLFEGIFERRVPGYDHFAFVDVPRTQWNLILTDISALHEQLLRANRNGVDLPYGNTLGVAEVFRRDVAGNQHRLAALLSEVEAWARETLIVHDCISVLGL